MPRVEKIRLTIPPAVGPSEDLVLLELAVENCDAPVFVGPVMRGMLVTFYTQNSATTRRLEDLYV